MQVQCQFILYVVAAGDVPLTEQTEHLSDRRDHSTSLPAQERTQLSYAIKDETIVATSEYDSAYQNDLGLIQLLLDFHDRIRLPGILVFLDICSDLREGDGRRRAILFHGDLCNEVVYDLSEQRECRTDGVFGIGDDNS